MQLLVYVLKVLDLFEREPAPMIVKESNRELSSPNRRHISPSCGVHASSVMLLYRFVPALLRTEIQVWFPHGSFGEESLLSHLPLALNAGPDTKPEGLWLGLEQVSDFSNLAIFTFRDADYSC
ncbi:MAG: hypothetical protein R3C11_19105 [Planctomycetaceae bacterium]